MKPTLQSSADLAANILEPGIPTVSTLIAFECAARHGNFSRAAEELHTSQSAISRQIARLEEQLSVRVFDRSRIGVSLTQAGSYFHNAVVAGLGQIRQGIVDARQAANEEQVVISCSHDSWQFVLCPHLDALRKTLGEHVRIQVRFHDHQVRGARFDSGADVVFAWQTHNKYPEALALREAVSPVCSPGYASRNVTILNGPIRGWSALTLLHHSSPDSKPASWEDWFRVVGRPEPMPRTVGFDSYVGAIEAASAGHGIALGRRYFIERYLETEALVTVADGFIEFDSYFAGLLAENGKRNPIAHDCLEFFAETLGRRS